MQDTGSVVPFHGHINIAQIPNRLISVPLNRENHLTLAVQSNEAARKSTQTPPSNQPCPALARPRPVAQGDGVVGSRRYMLYTARASDEKPTLCLARSIRVLSH